MGEHIHFGARREIPATDILIEYNSILENAINIINLGDVPVSNVLIEGTRTTEHGPHAIHIARVPPTNVLIEGTRSTEHVAHISYERGSIARVSHWTVVAP